MWPPRQQRTGVITSVPLRAASRTARAHSGRRATCLSDSRSSGLAPAARRSRQVTAVASASAWSPKRPLGGLPEVAQQRDVPLAQPRVAPEPVEAVDDRGAVALVLGLEVHRPLAHAVDDEVEQRRRDRGRAACRCGRRSPAARPTSAPSSQNDSMRSISSGCSARSAATCSSSDEVCLLTLGDRHHLPGQLDGRGRADPRAGAW